ncbi:MAG: hypothetical protein AAGI22_12080 [Planctomycetota bacterium]
MTTLPLRAAARATRRAGLTLIELVVVLTILVALGSLLVPVIGNALTRSHVATCASNIPEVARVLIGFGTTNTGFGDDWYTGIYGAATSSADEVVNNSVTTFTTTGGGGNGAGAGVTPTALVADEVAALASIGIANVLDHGDVTSPGFDVTFNINPIQEAVAVGTLVQTLTLTGAQSLDIVDPTAVALPAATKYIWLGIDKRTDLVGLAFPEPPVHFGDTEGFLPQQVYSRFGAIFEIVDEIPGDGEASIRFVQVSYSLDGDAYETADNHIAIHWNEVNGTGL